MLAAIRMLGVNSTPSSSQGGIEIPRNSYAMTWQFAYINEPTVGATK